MKALRLFFVCIYLAIGTMPLFWLFWTSIKSRDDSISVRAKFIPALTVEPARESHRFRPGLEGYRSLGRRLGGTSHSFYFYMRNSLVIGLASTVASVVLGMSCAYGFSRYRIAGANDWLFFILSTRFLPPLAVVVPVLVMFRKLGLDSTHLGLALLYTTFNLSLSVWLMKGFIDDIPRSYEEAAMIDGYSNWSIFWRIVVPQAQRGMAVTGVFCLISAWNEYGFAVTLNQLDAVKTVPVYFAGLQYNIHGLPWHQVAAGALLYVVPIIIFTILVRRHLLRGMTFGAIKQ